eukprot:SM000203S06124  [mRNA]  locus=s203:34063:35493:+ [translate_table: standard]
MAGGADAAADAERERERERERRRRKVVEYERFLEERLKADLQLLTDESKDLAKSIGLIQQQKLTRMRSMVSLGSEVYMQADLPDTSRIFVNVSLGFYVEFKLPEAISFAATKEQHLKKRADAQTDRIVDLKAQVKLVTEGIRELMSIPWEA